MANIIQTVTKYLPDKVDKVFRLKSLTAVLENGSKWIDVDFKESGYVKIADVLVDGLADYKSVNSDVTGGADYAHYAGQNGVGVRDGLQRGNGAVKWEIFKRGKEIPVDYIEDEEAAGVLMANLMTEFIETKVVPEVDILRFMTMVKKTSTSLGNRVTSLTLTDENVFSAMHQGFKWFTENRVPSDEQIIYVEPNVMNFIRESKFLVRYLSQIEYKNGNGVTFKLEAYEGRPIIEVPSDMFLTDVVTTNNGVIPAAGSKVISILMVSKKAIIPIRKLEWNKIFRPGEVPGFYGYLADFLMYHGVVIPKNKVPGIYAVISTTTADGVDVSRRVLPLLYKGTTENAIGLEQYYTMPAGLLGKLIVSESNTDLVLNTSAYSNGALKEGLQLVPAGFDEFGNPVKVEFTTATNANTIYFGLIDGYGNIIAVSKAIDVTGYKG